MMDPSSPNELATRAYFDRSFSLPAIKVMPGEYYATGQPMLLITVLGSCVAVCLRDPGRNIGGMNHFMLPEGAEEDQSPLSKAARYGGYAMEVLINQLIKLGARRNHLRAKVFGGSQVLAAAARQAIGERNAEFALAYLAAEGIPVDAQDLLDIHPRKVYFFTATGRVLVRKLKDPQGNTLDQREARYRQRLARAPAAGDVELFDSPQVTAAANPSTPARRPTLGSRRDRVAAPAASQPKVRSP